MPGTPLDHLPYPSFDLIPVRHARTRVRARTHARRFARLLAAAFVVSTPDKLNYSASRAPERTHSCTPTRRVRAVAASRLGAHRLYAHKLRSSFALVAGFRLPMLREDAGGWSMIAGSTIAAVLTRGLRASRLMLRRTSRAVARSRRAGNRLFPTTVNCARLGADTASSLDATQAERSENARLLSVLVRRLASQSPSFTIDYGNSAPPARAHRPALASVDDRSSLANRIGVSALATESSRMTEQSSRRWMLPFFPHPGRATLAVQPRSRLQNQGEAVARSRGPSPRVSDFRCHYLGTWPPRARCSPPRFAGVSPRLRRPAQVKRRSPSGDARRRTFARRYSSSTFARRRTARYIITLAVSPRRSNVEGVRRARRVVAIADLSRAGRRAEIVTGCCAVTRASRPCGAGDEPDRPARRRRRYALLDTTSSSRCACIRSDAA